MTPAPGWRDEDTDEPRPTEPCKSCGAMRWAVYKPTARWICASCGAYARRQSHATAVRRNVMANQQRLERSEKT
jgi:hypothetical protein